MAFRRPTARSGDCGSQPASGTAARDTAWRGRRHQPPLPRRFSPSLFLRWPPTTIPLSENNMVARADHGIIRPGTRSRRGPQMSATPDSTLADPQQLIADLQRQLADAAQRWREQCRARRGAGRSRPRPPRCSGHQFLARRPRAGVRRDARKGDAAVRGALRHLWTYDGERFHAAQSAACPRLR